MKRLALFIPPIRRLWEDREKLITQRDGLRSENELLSAEIGGLRDVLRDSQTTKLQPTEKLTYAQLIGDHSFIPIEPTVMGMQAGLCRQRELASDNYRYWCDQMQLEPALHRKWWEYFFITQCLFERGLLQPSRRGLAFGVGIEPLPALFAKMGCHILTTDQAAETAVEGGWIKGGMHAANLEQLLLRNICPRDTFYERVSFKPMDMNDIDSELNNQFDFCWSTCSLEHLGSLEHGLRFIENSLETLKPGGVAVHTTEYNLSSNDQTLEHKDLSLYRRRDIESLIVRLERAGHSVAPVNFDIGGTLVDGYIDLPPYHSEPHMRIQVGEFACTSIGLVVTRRR
ncbi:class I SAM-dependent methyltransferase [Rhizobium rhizogenes]|uniref:class I SAM-dependent methyltransferase n=1 Tax=Rhizobium rhizogenes TaxID=359 RepID=UPI0013AF03C6|nr:class I SAM-dependent methyltransferase [Rhizobium rhizogenes]QRM39288.1 class I SAM-dependent methyltransferase [Rhizobium rhizogenes]